MALNFEVVSKHDFLRKYRECVESREKSGMIRTLAELTGGSSKDVVSQLISMGVKREELPGTVLRYLSPEQEELLRQNEEQKAAEPVQTKSQYAEVPDCRDKSSVFEEMAVLKREDKYDVINEKIVKIAVDQETAELQLPEVIKTAIRTRLQVLEDMINIEKRELIDLELQMEQCAADVQRAEQERDELRNYL